MCNSIAIVTDTNSGMTLEQAENLGVTIIPMPFYINGELYFEGVNLDADGFYKHLADNSEVNTSQPAPGDVMKIWDELLKEKEEIIYIPMSSSLSGSCQTAEVLSQDYDNKVHVVDNRRISVTQLQSVKDAVNLAKKGMSGEEIKKILEDRQYQSSIYVTPDDLDYLKKGGRITPAVASVAKVLNIKPVLEIQGKKLDVFKKVRGMKQARRIMKQAIRKDLEDRFSDIDTMKIYAAYTSNIELGEFWKSELEEEFPGYEIELYPLSLSVSCHIGPESLGIGCVEEIR
ncbi:DegV family protein [Clostridium butyricum]|uniref:DegV family protein n=1 Tax=Clostridium butyricum E4 str. BoNT E BL5262 TaxID=632245 RepID=C4IB05_CLOBU|nr:DegV family protein [Clostridium butyricum]EEP56455.1 DegV family protein [Clostridium butyricum E4 str. BoNT E BL5262]NFS20399.1 DegV family protein [Clostridium butyricum]